MTPKVFVLIPAYNEKDNIQRVVTSLLELQSQDTKLVHKVIVCDNNSDDGTGDLARSAGAEVVYEGQKGYGKACLKAISHLYQHKPRANDIVVFVDGDNSVKVSELPFILDILRKRKGLVVGARVSKNIETGAMSPQQRVGNIVASALIRWLWNTSVTDLGPFRALHFRDLHNLYMQDEAFGWTTEMQIKCIAKGLPYTEIHVSTLRRAGHSKISGTLRGTIGAAHGIFSTIFWFWWQQRTAELSFTPKDKIS